MLAVAPLTMLGEVEAVALNVPNSVDPYALVNDVAPPHCVIGGDAEPCRSRC